MRRERGEEMSKRNKTEQTPKLNHSYSTRSPPSHTHARTHAHTHTCMCTHTHTHTHTHRHRHRHTQNSNKIIPIFSSFRASEARRMALAENEIRKFMLERKKKQSVPNTPSTLFGNMSRGKQQQTDAKKKDSSQQQAARNRLTTRALYDTEEEEVETEPSEHDRWGKVFCNLWWCGFCYVKCVTRTSTDFKREMLLHLWSINASLCRSDIGFLKVLSRDVNLPLFGGIPLFFLLSAFLKFTFRFFWKIAKIFFFYFITDTTTIDCSKSFGKESETSWFAVVRFSISGWSTRSKFKAPYLHARSHAACWRTAMAASTKGRGGWWFSGGMEDGLEVIARVLHPLPFRPHHFTHTHTLSLSLSHTHTHTHFQVCQLLRFRRSMLWSVLACYTRAKNATITCRKIDLILFSRPETQ